MKVEVYVPKVEKGIIMPNRSPTVYTRKIAAGELRRIAEQIKPGTMAKRGRDGESVVLPVGSIGKFKQMVKARGLQTVCFRGQSETEARVWVIAG